MTIPKLEDPIELFNQWHQEARKTDLDEPDAFCLSTCDTNGMPSSRMLLVKGADQEGFVFYTNLGSRKAKQLQENPQAAMCFHWQPLRKQIRVQGHIQPVSPEEADAYFASRIRGSQIGAWASKQTQSMAGPEELLVRFAEFAEKFEDQEVPRPEFWSGFRLKPIRIEFWQAADARLHERLEYRLLDDGTWATDLLFP